MLWGSDSYKETSLSIAGFLLPFCVAPSPGKSSFPMKLAVRCQKVVFVPFWGFQVGWDTSGALFGARIHSLLIQMHPGTVTSELNWAIGAAE